MISRRALWWLAGGCGLSSIPSGLGSSIFGSSSSTPEAAPGVDRVVPISKPYKLASNQFKHHAPSVFDIGEAFDLEKLRGLLGPAALAQGGEARAET